MNFEYQTLNIQFSIRLIRNSVLDIRNFFNPSLRSPFLPKKADRLGKKRGMVLFIIIIEHIKTFFQSILIQIYSCKSLIPERFFFSINNIHYQS